jgi:hypothetical protein
MSMPSHVRLFNKASDIEKMIEKNVQWIMWLVPNLLSFACHIDSDCYIFEEVLTQSDNAYVCP